MKKVGKTYSCDFECETNYGEKGVCKESLARKIFKKIFIIAFILISVIVVYLIWNDKKVRDIITRR